MYSKTKAFRQCRDLTSAEGFVIYISIQRYLPPLKSNRQGVILFTLFTILIFMSAKVTFNFKSI